jgi:NAD(P)-dependent dehydrogenase (short-subunit alcohol dehydrogenase family)
MSSVHEDWPVPGNTAYCQSKCGGRMLTRTAGQERDRCGAIVGQCRNLAARLVADSQPPRSERRGSDTTFSQRVATPGPSTTACSMPPVGCRATPGITETRAPARR